MQEATRAARAANAALVAERRAAGARSSTYNGVSWAKSKQQWQAQHSDINGCVLVVHLGHFDDEAEAAKAVDKALEAAGRDGEVNFRDGQATNFRHDRHGDPLKKSSPYHGGDASTRSLHQKEQGESPGLPALVPQ